LRVALSLKAIPADAIVEHFTLTCGVGWYREGIDSEDHRRIMPLKEASSAQ
jgi:hypothetical protein